MDNLIRQSQEQAAATKTSYFRPLYHELPWEWRLIGIKGARGVGKTTLLLQRIRALAPAKAIFVLTTTP